MQIVSYPELCETTLKGNHPSTSFFIVHRYKGLKPLSRACKEMVIYSNLQNTTVGKPPCNYHLVSPKLEVFETPGEA